MKNAFQLLLISICLGVCLPLQAQEQDASKPAKPQLWMMPPSPDTSDGRILRSLFENPDQWKETRSKIDVLGYADWVMNKQFTDEELRKYLPLLQTWNLKLVLEIGALKPWGPTAAQAFARGQQHWDRIQSLGGKIFGVTMDEPLTFTRSKLKQPDSYAVEQTAQFTALVRKKYPTFWIEDTETFPTISVADHMKWIDALQNRLKQMNVRGLDSYRLDVDWVAFETGKKENQKGPWSWADVKQVENGCRQRHLPFNLIYWPSDKPALKLRGLADDSTWYTEVFSEGYGYALAGGSPDIYCVQSWVEIPSEGIPETGSWTFTRSVLDFANKFVRAKK